MLRGRAFDGKESLRTLTSAMSSRSIMSGQLYTVRMQCAAPGPRLAPPWRWSLQQLDLACECGEPGWPSEEVVSPGPGLCDQAHSTEKYCVSQNARTPSRAPSRPMPLCFTPPNGAAGSETTPRLMPIIPASIRSAS